MAETKPPDVFVEVRGGVADVSVCTTGIRVEVRDYDIEGGVADPRLSFIDEDGNECCRYFIDEDGDQTET